MKSMGVFSLRDAVVGEYQAFATSFTTIQAEDIRKRVEAIYAEGRFLPDPLIQINPSYKAGAAFAALTAGGALHPRIPEVFQAEGVLLRLHKHQKQAIVLGAQGKSLPDELLHVFQAKTSGLPRSTEAERLVVQRVGQDIFRQGLLECWEGRCAITGLAIPELLRASHIKPWAACESDAERLDIYNGLLLAPHLDALFDQGFITVADDGKAIVSSSLNSGACGQLGLEGSASWRVGVSGHRAYLRWHRERVFKKM